MFETLHSLMLVEDDAAPQIPSDADAIICRAAAFTGLSSAERIILRLDGDDEAALRAIVRRRPLAVTLEHWRTGAELQRFDVLLSVAEAEEGIPLGNTRILAWTDGMLPPPFAETGSAGKSRRLAGIIWDWRALAAALDATRAFNRAGEWTPAFAHARATTLLAARTADVAAYDVAPPGDGATFAENCRDARADGFSGRLALEPAQLAAINAAFDEPR
ncbi:citrate lyase subunit beta/citryl-CoA lyase [Rhizobium subbaraonis]|uniref:Citrate lyase subunit beta/citryl-CoA lyase n=1 Tax=Rhizobium subbaraonis TaxID=908946 RepID=A0A285UBT7_9HYPH|nr:hypothetical protein [Rhizobium subbaraonis]SOC38868.1 citrate lyase subunit beta/citryl-CoA lyase [Rhizobium subbaraonis]